MVSTPHPVSLPKMPLASKQWPQWDCRAPSVQHIFKASLVQHIIDQTKAELNASSVGFGSPQPAGVEAVTGLWRSAHSIWLCPGGFLPSHISALGNTLPRARGSPGWLHSSAQEGWVARTIPAVHFPPCLTEEFFPSSYCRLSQHGLFAEGSILQVYSFLWKDSPSHHHILNHLIVGLFKVLYKVPFCVLWCRNYWMVSFSHYHAGG